MSTTLHGVPANLAASRNIAVAVGPPAWLGHVARRLYRERRERDLALACELLHEGGWDLLLDLYACTAAGERVCITSACAAACVPATTAQRLVIKLEKNGLIERLKDESDRRVRYLVLTEAAERMLTRYLESVAANRDCWTDPSRVQDTGRDDHPTDLGETSAADRKACNLHKPNGAQAAIQDRDRKLAPN